MKKEKEGRIGEPQKVFLGMVAALILTTLALLLYHGGDTLYNYNWSEKWNNNCGLYSCE